MCFHVFYVWPCLVQSTPALGEPLASLALIHTCFRCWLVPFRAREKHLHVSPRIDDPRAPYPCIQRSDRATERFPNVSTKGRGYQIRAMTEGPEGWEELRKVSVWQTTAALQQEMGAKMIKARQSGREKKRFSFLSMEMHSLMSNPVVPGLSLPSYSNEGFVRCLVNNTVLPPPPPPESGSYFSFLG